MSHNFFGVSINEKLINPEGNEQSRIQYVDIYISTWNKFNSREKFHLNGLLTKVQYTTRALSIIKVKRPSENNEQCFSHRIYIHV